MAISPLSAANLAMRSMASSLPSLPEVQAPDQAGAAGFDDVVVNSLENLDQLHKTADDLAIQAATGDLADVHEYTIAASQAEIATQLTVAVRDRAVEAFTEIMRMQF